MFLTEIILKKVLKTFCQCALSCLVIHVLTVLFLLSRCLQLEDQSEKETLPSLWQSDKHAVEQKMPVKWVAVYGYFNRRRFMWRDDHVWITRTALFSFPLWRGRDHFDSLLSILLAIPVQVNPTWSVRSFSEWWVNIKTTNIARKNKKQNCLVYPGPSFCFFAWQES